MSSKLTKKIKDRLTNAPSQRNQSVKLQSKLIQPANQMTDFFLKERGGGGVLDIVLGVFVDIYF